MVTHSYNMAYDWYANTQLQYYKLKEFWLKNSSVAQNIRINKRCGSNDPDTYLHALYTMLPKQAS